MMAVPADSAPRITGYPSKEAVLSQGAATFYAAASGSPLVTRKDRPMRMEDEQEDVTTKNVSRAAYMQKVVLTIAGSRGISSKTPERFDELASYLFLPRSFVADLFDCIGRSRDGLTPEMRASKKIDADRLKPFRDMIRQNKLLMEELKASMGEVPVRRARGKKTLSPSSTKAAECAPDCEPRPRARARDCSARQAPCSAAIQGEKG